MISANVPMTDYGKFLDSKSQLDGDNGFEPVSLLAALYDFQEHLGLWALRKGRAAIYADCGLGKTPMQLAWAEAVNQHTNRPVLILTPLAVSRQTCREAEKFGIEASRSQDGKHKGGIVVTNYERLTGFNPDDFAGVVCDESSCIKNFAGKRKAMITEFMRTIPYRLLCTATAAPNDYHELGTSSEALGYLGYSDMLTRFFKEDTIKDHLGWGRKSYRFRGHAEHPFWRWVCSWARACRKPSDLGFSDERYNLPRLIETEHIIECSKPRDGYLFALPAKGLGEQREERRSTMTERCQAVADIAAGSDGATVTWCHLNPEADLIENMISDGVQVSGSMRDEVKEERLLAFQDGEIQHLVTKPKIGCWGLNWQHCHQIQTFPSHSWEQYYQAIRRCYRFGQEEEVRVDIVTTEGEVGVLRNLQRKAIQADKMFAALTAAINNELHIKAREVLGEKEEVPAWL